LHPGWPDPHRLQSNHPHSPFLKLTPQPRQPHVFKLIYHRHQHSFAAASNPTMPSSYDLIFIAFLALLLFGPKKLPELARYAGKLLAEFRRASAEFRLQMDDEFRAIEQAEQQKKIAALEAAAPVAALNIPEPEHPHTPPPMEPTPEIAVPEHSIADTPGAPPQTVTPSEVGSTSNPPTPPIPIPLPIASNGDLHLMPPATGLPTARSSSLSALFDAIPHTPESAPAEPEASHNA
jgi:sec-independent protein translocase protein TatB